MRFLHLLPAVFGLLSSSAFGEIIEFHFPSEKNDYLCPGMAFRCQPPAVCSRDTLTNKFYCCEPDRSGMCWTGSEKCDGGNQTMPGVGQLGCGVFCCLDRREECTQLEGQINICWATQVNPMLNYTKEEAAALSSSLSAAHPRATEWPVDILQVSSTSSSSTSTPTSSSSTVTSSTLTTGSAPTVAAPSNAATNVGKPSNGLSAGAIAGIVVGGVGVLAIAGAGAYFLWRRKRPQKNMPTEMDANPYTDNPLYAQQLAQEKYAHVAASEVYAPVPPAEMGGMHISELPGHTPHYGIMGGK